MAEPKSSPVGALLVEVEQEVRKELEDEKKAKLKAQVRAKIQAEEAAKEAESELVAAESGMFTHRLRSPHMRNKRELPAGQLITPTPNEMKFFPDKFTRVESVQELKAEQDAQLAQDEAALTERKKALASAA